MSIEADRAKLQLLGVEAWRSGDNPERWAACADWPVWNESGWVSYKDENHSKYKYNGDMRIMAPTEEELIQIVLEEVRLHGCVTFSGI